MTTEQQQELKDKFKKVFFKRTNVFKSSRTIVSYETDANYDGDVFDWFLENWPKEEVKQEPFVYYLRHRREFLFKEHYDAHLEKGWSAPQDFDKLYLNPTEEKKEEWVSVPDIRNKLSPITNLIAMIENGLLKGNIDTHDLVIEEIKQCKESIKYLSQQPKTK